MRLPQRAEDRFFEVSTYASEIHDAPPVDKDELAGYEPRQFANLENVTGCVVNHGRRRCELSACEVSRVTPQVT